ncbi:MAG: hypothetical protein M1376_07135 [Planctomycetes bacterium]|nr:hypothetical protein [Planctomycetota bacterium]
MMPAKIQQYIQQLLSYVEAADYAGYDPYDALNSPLLRRLGARSKAIRIGAIQLLRRCPVNLRPVLGIPKGHNPKGIGLFLESCARLHSMEPAMMYRNRIDHLTEMLRRTSTPGYAGCCWGYNFPWQSRTVYRPSYTPTIVNTAFIGHGLLDAYEATGHPGALEMAVSTRGFLLRDLNRKTEGGEFCFSYSPRVHDYVHNANALGASLLLRIAHATGEATLKDTAYESMGYTVKHQREDGAWSFAEGGRSWVDSYHTGFVLESLRRFVKEKENGCPAWRENYARGVEYYARKLFLEDGTPKHYDNQVHPLDIHCAAEAICFFSGEGLRFRALTEKVMRWMFENLWDARGFFYYRRGRFVRTRIPYMRWSQAWGLRALATFLSAREREPHGEFDHGHTKPHTSGGHLF